MSAAGSSDPDAEDVLTYAWSFGDGGTATGVAASHSYAQDGVYSVHLVVTDSRGLVNETTSTATVGNVAPSIAPFATATLLPGETYAAAGSFSDPGADSWNATVDYGDGSGVAALPLSGKSFTLSHTYLAPGVFTVTVRVTDDDVTSTRMRMVTVLTPGQAVQNALLLVQQLDAAGTLNRGNANSLAAKLDAAAQQLGHGNATAAANQLRSLLNELDALERSGRLSAADALPLRTLIGRLLASLAT